VGKVLTGKVLIFFILLNQLLPLAPIPVYFFFFFFYHVPSSLLPPDGDCACNISPFCKHVRSFVFSTVASYYKKRQNLDARESRKRNGALYLLRRNEQPKKYGKQVGLRPSTIAQKK